MPNPRRENSSAGAGFAGMALGFLILSGSPVSHADETVPSISGFLMNTREMSALRATGNVPSLIVDKDQKLLNFWTGRSHKFGFENLNSLFPIATLDETDDLCRDLGFGCLVVNYTSDSRKTLLYAGENHIQIRPREFSLLGAALKDSDLYDPWMSAHVRRQLATLSDYRYQSFSQRLPEDLKGLELQPALRQKGAISAKQAESFISYAAEHPRVFNRLSIKFQKSLRKDQNSGTPSERSQLLEKTLTTMLLLTLDALTKVADSRSLLYPYLNDNLVLPETLIPMDRLYSELHAIKTADGQTRWPQIRHLKESDREHFDDIFRERYQNGYLADGVYEPESNTIYLDLTRPFFEAAFTLYHELWHVKAFHSPQVREYATNIRTLLRLPDSVENEILLRQTLLRYFAEHELLALDQGARLYHAVGQLVNQWGPVTYSQKAWHDSEFGDSPLIDLYIPPTLRRPSGEWQSISLPSQILGIPALVEAPIRLKTMAYLRTQRRKLLSRKMAQLQTLEQFLESREPIHLRNYQDRYFKDLSSFDLVSVKSDLKILPSSIELPTPVTLSCLEVDRIVKALGGTSQYGLPFPYTVDGGWEKCQSLRGGLLARSFKLKVRSGLPNLRGPSLQRGKQK